MDRQEFALGRPRLAGLMKGAFRQGKPAQAYLLWGSPRCDFLAAGRFLAQSFLCEKGGLACGQCPTCRRFSEGVHPDFIQLDGFDSAIRKDDVEALKNAFAMTAVESKGRMVYLIAACGNMTNEAANSLLKFLEEPAPGITAILTTSNLETVLPTIVSRCETVKLQPLSREDIYHALAARYSPEISYFLSDYSGDSERLEKAAGDEGFAKAAALANDFILSLEQGRAPAAYTLLSAAASGLPDSRCYNWFYGDVSRFLGDAIAQGGRFGPYGAEIENFGRKQQALAARMQVFLQESLRMSTANLSFTGVLAQLAQMILRPDGR